MFPTQEELPDKPGEQWGDRECMHAPRGVGLFYGQQLHCAALDAVDRCSFYTEPSSTRDPIRQMVKVERMLQKGAVQKGVTSWPPDAAYSLNLPGKAMQLLKKVRLTVRMLRPHHHIMARSKWESTLDHGNYSLLERLVVLVSVSVWDSCSCMPQ